MNFLQLLTSGASGIYSCDLVLNFNFQGKMSEGSNLIGQSVSKSDGFQRVLDKSIEVDISNFPQESSKPNQAELLKSLVHFVFMQLERERQELINRYLQLNLQLMEGKLPSLTEVQSPIPPIIKQDSVQVQSQH